jgi:hypothetical protein
MQDVINKLTAEQALEVVKRLSGTGGKIQEAVIAEARNVLSEIDLDETADEVFFVLDSIDVEDCWDRAGSSRNGYTSPDEAALEIVEGNLQPFLDQTRRYHELGMPGEEMTHCMGLILGIYRYEHESKSEFREWSVDIPLECAGDRLREWRERGQGLAFAEAMDEFIQQRCPNWARYLLRTGGRT